MLCVLCAVVGVPGPAVGAAGGHLGHAPHRGPTKGLAHPARHRQVRHPFMSFTILILGCDGQREIVGD